MYLQPSSMAMHEAEVSYDAGAYPRIKATWQRHRCIPKAIICGTSTFMEQTRGSRVGLVQTRAL